MSNEKTPLSIEDLIVDGTKKVTVTKDGKLVIKKSDYEKALDKPLKHFVTDNKCMSLNKIYDKDVVAKLMTPDEKADQSSILSTTYISKNTVLIIQSKVWDNKPYFDFRVWYKNSDGNFLPTKKGFMIALSYKDGEDEINPLNNFFNVINELRKLPKREEIN